MSREARRAPKNFNWPLHEVWWGYVLDPMPCQERFEDGDHAECQVCEGEGRVYSRIECPAFAVNDQTDGQKRRAERLDYGWQMWETTSEGSPTSPVCDSPEELAHWLTDSGASTFAGMTTTYKRWLAMIRAGSSVASTVAIGDQLVSGVDAVSDV
jgi:hypothetical protein